MAEKAQHILVLPESETKPGGFLREFFPPKSAKYARLLIMLNGYIKFSSAITAAL